MKTFIYSCLPTLMNMINVCSSLPVILSRRKDHTLLTAAKEQRPETWLQISDPKHLLHYILK